MGEEGSRKSVTRGMGHLSQTLTVLSTETRKQGLYITLSSGDPAPEHGAQDVLRLHPFRDQTEPFLEPCCPGPSPHSPD